MKNILQLLLVFLLAISSANANAGELCGKVVNAISQQPVAYAKITVINESYSAYSNQSGDFCIKLEQGTHQLKIERAGFFGTTMVNQSPNTRKTSVNLFPLFIPADTQPSPNAFGIPHGSGQAPDGPPVDLSKYPWNRIFAKKQNIGLRYTISVSALPEKIRVGRRFSSTCSGYDIQQIDEINFEDYVKGVVNAEIGVFNSAVTNPKISDEKGPAESFKLFAVAARSYAFWFYLKNPDAEYHLDDTACNQRYDDARNASINAAVDATAGMIFVKASDHTIVDKYEYAASDGRTGCRPWGSTDIFPDDPEARACVGTWCGHDNCAAHEDNPLVPGTDKCLVRGICQWGSAERSMLGDSFLTMAEYYQPNLDVITFNGTNPDPNEGTDLVGFIREGDIQTGTEIIGASVTIQMGIDEPQTTTTDKTGLYAFRSIKPGTYTVTATAQGYKTASAQKEVAQGIVNWQSFGLQKDTPDEDAGTDDTGTDTGVDTGSDTGAEDSGAEDIPAVGDTGNEDTGSDDVAETDTTAEQDTGAEPETDVGSNDTQADTGAPVDAENEDSSTDNEENGDAGSQKDANGNWWKDAGVSNGDDEDYSDSWPSFDEYSSDGCGCRIR